MKISEDRFPLLFVYLEDQEEKYDLRTRTLTRGASTILSKWPQYLTFVSYMSVIGLFALVLCFVISLLVLSFTTPLIHHPRRFSLVKCGVRGGSNQAFTLSDFERPVDTDNATFIVDVHTDEYDHSTVACAVESYLMWTNLPVYHVRLIPKGNLENVTFFRQLQEKFHNYKLLTVPLESFLSGTSFAGSKIGNRSTLGFLSKILISWNFGGTVLDSSLITLSNFDILTNNTESSLLLGLTGKENVLISGRRVCHSFIFSVMKYLTKETNSTSQAEVIKDVHREFCDRGRNCSSIRILSRPFFCESEEEGCVFLNSKNKSNREAWSRVCPLAKFLT